MNYQKIYDALIASRKSRTTPDGYHEVHHIIPKSLGGDDSSENLIRLTAREHYIAHWILAKIHGGSQWFIVHIMSSGVGRSANGHFPSSRQVGISRKKYLENRGDIYGENNPNFGNDKVKGDGNGRYNKEIYVWQSKHTGELIEATCYESYTKHGMSKPGVISCISGKRAGVKNWFFLGPKGNHHKKQRKVGMLRMCNTCFNEKPEFGFPRGGKAKCRKCYSEHERQRTSGGLGNERIRSKRRHGNEDAEENLRQLRA